MKIVRTFLVVFLASLPLKAFSAEASLLSVELGTVEVTAPKLTKPGLGETGLGESDLATRRSSTSDSARLLQDIPGVSIYGAGGVSSLPVIHGMADDRVNVQVDDMGLMPACPNHMNSALSYIDPTNVGSVKVFAGITPVSVGGDSIGGTIQVNSAPPEFANAEEKTLLKGKTGVFFRSNGNVYGGNIAATAASENLNLTYSASSTQSRNYMAAADFKAAGPGAAGGAWLGGNVVGSTAYTSVNQDIGFALRHDIHLLQLNMGLQHIPFEGFPNQRMDMTANNSTQINLRYSGLYQWGDLDARIYQQNINHAMNMGVDRVTYGSLGMPMDTKGKTIGTMVKGNIIISEKDILRVGMETQNYTLYDWWPQAGGMMGPNTFWNVDYGQRNKLDLFGEWEAIWNSRWLTQLGMRSDTFKTNAAAVQGYDNGALWVFDAVAFNALDHQHTDNNWDMTALTRYTPSATEKFDAGYARKSRSPNLYQRYPWSTQPMATLMNNFVGDGNGYVGNNNLNPEVAHTFSVTGDWHDADKEKTALIATGYYTYIQGYIDAQRCNVGQCGGSANVNATSGFLNLTYVNQTARLYGVEVSGHALFGNTDSYGSFTGTGVLNYVSGVNLSTGDNLYNIMPLNTKLAITERLSGWSNTAEVQLVAAKTQVAQVRNEVQTGAYNLFNLRSSYEWKRARLDIAIENVFNRYYSMPLGGVYVGQGASMAINGIPWGVAVPGMGRSINTALSVRF
jgi:iron complex outermembrane receptor protein